jgi:hypothetical protein
VKLVLDTRYPIWYGVLDEKFNHKGDNKMGLTGTNAEPKHLQIYGAATRLINRIDNFEKLLDEINPRPPSKIEVTPMADGPLTLSEFLSSEANRLDNAASKLESLIEELRGAVF